MVILLFKIKCENGFGCQGMDCENRFVHGYTVIQNIIANMVMVIQNCYTEYHGEYGHDYTVIQNIVANMVLDVRASTVNTGLHMVILSFRILLPNCY
jgi:hypothetical protein